jgi:hypothetical protein
MLQGALCLAAHHFLVALVWVNQPLTFEVTSFWSVKNAQWFVVMPPS